ncbi:MAG: hypothetical protein AB1750_15060 [Chloroflexota bacterium]
MDLPPIVALYNNLETFYPFLQRSNDPDIFEKRKYRGDRGLFWLGPAKLLFTTAPAPGAREICDRWGYRQTDLISPRAPTHQLSLDLARDPELIQRIVDYAGPKRAIRLVPYATTKEFFQLADALTRDHGLTVHLPESPQRDSLWLRNYVDTKAGFRSLVKHWLGDDARLPQGFACRNIFQAAEVVTWFLRRGRPCVVKADGGESGIGHIVFGPGAPAQGSVLERLQEDPFLRDDLVIIEEFIPSTDGSSPSLEFFVPPFGEGEPCVTYLSGQIFEQFGRFAGVLIGREMTRSAWYPALEKSGLKVARELQTAGYAGTFDLDCVVDDAGNLWFLEINARRTGGTYVHEFACNAFGADYLSRVVVLSSNTIRCDGIRDTGRLLAALDDLLLPPGGSRGLVITVTSTIQSGEFGGMFIAPDEADALRLREETLARLAPMITT